MTTALPLTDAEREQIVSLAREGMSRNAIARRVERSPGSVSKVVAAAGLSFDRAEVRVATAAKQADNQARRAELQHHLLEDAHRLREQLWKPCLVYNFGGKDNTYEERNLEQPDFAGQRAIMATVGTAVDKMLKLDDAVMGRSDGPARSMLAELGTAITALADELPDDETGE